MQTSSLNTPEYREPIKAMLLTLTLSFSHPGTSLRMARPRAPSRGPRQSGVAALDCNGSLPQLPCKNLTSNRNIIALHGVRRLHFPDFHQSVNNFDQGRLGPLFVRFWSGRKEGKETMKLGYSEFGWRVIGMKSDP